MAWIEGTQKQVFEVRANPEDVLAFFANPEELRHCMSDLERHERLDDNTYAWTLREKSEKGLTFQGRYSVRYERRADEVVWSTVGEGNMRTSGRVRARAIAPQLSEVTYEETIATDLPIPKLAATVFGPIVGREIKRGVSHYLDAARKRLDQQH